LLFSIAQIANIILESLNASRAKQFQGNKHLFYSIIDRMLGHQTELIYTDIKKITFFIKVQMLRNKYINK